MHKKQIVLVVPALVAALAVLAAPSARSQNQGHTGHRVTPGSQAVAKNPAGQCWRAGYSTPAHAIMECVSSTQPVRQEPQR
jgi:hypothetical protein